jgi:RNA-splicing ligase RtcB
MSICLTGKYGNAKAFTDIIENSAMSQIIQILNQPFTADQSIRIMPDVHAGKGCTIGTTMTIKDKIVPNLVGVDIGCGVLAIKFKENRIDLPKFDSVIHNTIPAGMNVHKVCKDNRTSINLTDLRCYGKAKIKDEYIYKSIGTLGGGNHFIELDRDSENNIWLVIHTGSRNLGKVVCEYYQNLAYSKLKNQTNGGDRKSKINEIISRLKAEHKENLIQETIETFNKTYLEEMPQIPYELCYVENDDFNDYIYDMNMVQKFACDNRAEIASLIIKNAKLHEIERFESIHNYIDIDNMVLRKGAISAKLNEKVIIPMNMKDGSLICVGKGNPDWNYSAPHGAGRLMSRNEAKNTISMKSYKESMKGIYSTSVCKETIDESVFAYKPMQSIVNNISETVDILDIIKPIYNFKAAE